MAAPSKYVMSRSECNVVATRGNPVDTAIMLLDQQLMFRVRVVEWDRRGRGDLPFISSVLTGSGAYPASCRIKPLNAKLNLICHLLALLGAHHILHVSRIRVNTGYSFGGGGKVTGA